MPQMSNNQKRTRGVGQTKATTTKKQSQPKSKSGVVSRPRRFGSDIKLAKPKQRDKNLKLAMSFPDLQIGYRILGNNEADPLHDEAAILLATSVAASLRPNTIVVQGDTMDLTIFSNFNEEPTFLGQSFQKSLDRTTMLWADLRRCMNGNGKMVWLEGNHEARFYEWLTENSSELFGIKRGNSNSNGGQKDSPVLDLAYLTRCAEYGVEVVPYRRGGLYGWWLEGTGTTLFTHGDKITSACTGDKYLSMSTNYNVVYGHTHRQELHWQTRRLAGDHKVNLFSASGGTLSRTDGAVPGYNSGKSSDGSALESFTNWQQGLVLVYYEEGKPYSEFVEVVKFNQNEDRLWCQCDGRIFSVSIEEKS